MAELLDYLPLFQEDATSIRARLDADVNAGLTSDDLRWIDTREGTFYWVVTQPVVIELARLWDALSLEVPASAFPLFAWGDYLDRHAEVFGLVRKDPVAAGGEVVFTGDPGTLVATGTTVSSDPATEDDEGQEFLTTVSGVIGDRLLTPSAPSATPSGTGGTLPAGTHYYRVTAVNEFGETVGSPENSAVTTGTTSKVTLDWPDVPGATGYRVYRSDVSGQDGVRLYDAAASTFIDTGLTSGIVGPPSVDSSGGVSLLVEATEEGEDGNVGALAITNLDSPNPGIDAVYNPAEMSGGTEEETDEELRQRILFEFEGQGAGTENDYKRWALAVPGVGRVFVNPVWQGPGTVQIVVMTRTGDAVAPSVVDAVQAALDPIPGQAKGQAPPGVTITVETPAVVPVNVTATVAFASGYSLDGVGGSIALREQIEDSIRQYIDALDVGEDVVYEHVKAQFFRVEGVYNISGVSVNGGTSNVAVADDPAQTAQFGTVTLS